MAIGKLRVASGDHSHSLGKCPAAPIVLGPRIVSIGLHMLTRAIAFMVVSTQHLLSTWQIAALYAFLAVYRNDSGNLFGSLVCPRSEGGP